MTTMVYFQGRLMADSRATNLETMEVMNDDFQKVFNVESLDITFNGEKALKMGYVGRLTFCNSIFAWNKYRLHSFEECLARISKRDDLHHDYDIVVVTARGAYVITCIKFDEGVTHTSTFIPRDCPAAVVLGSGAHHVHGTEYYQSQDDIDHVKKAWSMVRCKSTHAKAAKLGFEYLTQSRMVAVSKTAYPTMEHVIEHAALTDPLTNNKPIEAI